jgi:hypothetical protein
LTFYEAEDNRLIAYNLKQGATPYDLDASFSVFFSEYDIVQIDLIEPVQGGRKRKTRKHKRKQRKTRKSRR